MELTTKSITKATIRTSTQEMLKNFFAAYSDVLSDVLGEGTANAMLDNFTEVIRAIISEDPQKIRQIFRDGNVMHLLGSMQGELDKHEHYEILVMVRDGKYEIKVPFEDIQY